MSWPSVRVWATRCTRSAGGSRPSSPAKAWWSISPGRGARSSRRGARTHSPDGWRPCCLLAPTLPARASTSAASSSEGDRTDTPELLQRNFREVDPLRGTPRCAERAVVALRRLLEVRLSQLGTAHWAGIHLGCCSPHRSAPPACGSNVSDSSREYPAAYRRRSRRSSNSLDD